MDKDRNIVWTIGHSTRSLDEFLEMLRVNGIERLLDIRAFPGSRRYPHYNREYMLETLPAEGIDYQHLPGLGGRRKPDRDSPNVAWRHPSFRGYADYMQTPAFKSEIENLEALAREKRSAYMCSEAPWWKCHRALVSDYLKVQGWNVLHIMEKGRTTEHPFTSPARASQGRLFYDEVSPST